MKTVIQTLSFIVLAFASLYAPHGFAASDTVAQGSLTAAFSSWGKGSVAGDWKIVEENGQHFIELADNFAAKSGPDVKIFLSPTQADKVNGNNATRGSVLVKFLSKKGDFKGKARIAIPKGTDISQFKSLVFHCEAYSKLWGTSPIK